MLKVENYEIEIKEPVFENKHFLIYQCVNTQTSEKFFVKVIPKNIENNYELDVLNTIKQEYHMNVVKIYEIIHKFNFIFVIMEYFDQNLENYLKSLQYGNLSVEEIYQILTQIVYGYLHLKRLKIIMKNLNLNSIFVKQIQGKFLLKIVDFTFSHLINQKVQKIPESTVLAPEIFERQLYNEKCDIYSFGIIFYQMCYKGQNFRIKNQEDMRQFHQQIKNNPFQCPENNQIHQDYQCLIERMLTYNQNNRINWDELGIMLDQEFLILQDTYLIDFNLRCYLGMKGEFFYQTTNIKTQEQLAAKLVSLTNGNDKDLYTRLKDHQNENVIQVKEILLDENKNQFYLILENGQMSLSEYINKKQNFLKDEIIDFSKQIINGFCFLKSRNIVHGDLNLDNIIVKTEQNQKTQYKIAYFGNGSNSAINRSVKAGVPNFQAPEIISGRQFDSQCDIFSFGLILYYLISKKHYFQAQNEKDLQQAHLLLKTTPLQFSQDNDPEIAELIKKMVIFESQNRITWEQLQKDSLFTQIKGEIDIGQYLLAIAQLSISLLDSSKYYYQKLDFNFQTQVSYYNLILIRFCISCCTQLQNLLSNQTVLIGTTIFTPTLINDQFKVNYSNKQKEIIQQLKEKNLQIRNIIDNLPNTNKKTFAQSIIQQMDEKLSMKQNNFNLISDHNFLKQYYQSFRKEIQVPQININFRFHLEKILHLFVDFPIKKPLLYSLNDIFQENICIDAMETYLRNSQV